MGETYPLLMVVDLDPCMETWANHVDQIQIAREEYPHLYAVFCLDSHNTSYFYVREDGSYYWLHCRKGKDDIEVDADIIQMDIFGKPDLSKDFIMKEILSV